uniref:CSON000083 protein n=1 Tax=Culicoides sonorensis TaxID=179676 RepID=A0A336LT70_CULSO
MDLKNMKEKCGGYCGLKTEIYQEISNRYFTIKIYLSRDHPTIKIKSFCTNIVFKMIFLKFSLVIYCSLISKSIQLSTPESPTYTAAVVEYHKITSPEDPEQQVSDNYFEYQRIISSQEVRQADIIIFPESTLNTIDTAVYVPDVDDLITPCDNSTYLGLIQTISCAARIRSKYIVINLKEKSDCPDKQQIEFNDPRPCDHPNKTNVYNTNVVFDRTGRVIAKYRKFNLFGEKGTLKPYKYDVYFTIKIYLSRDHPTIKIKSFYTNFVFKMIFLKFSLVICFSLISKSIQLSTPESPTYTAAVVEYHKITSPEDPDQQVSDNYFEYQRIISSQEVRQADIIIFPESTLNTIDTAVYVPDVDDLITPCDNSTYLGLIQTISCAARIRSKYIVINLKEKSDCPDKQQIEYNDPRPCDHPNKTNVYNTNVVFDRTGRVIAKYRKFNLFGEKGTLKPYKYDVVTFNTDFNVTFGMFICFDLMFEHPPMDLVRKGVKDIIFTANWFSEIPFLSAVQIQQSWAYKNNVNLLAAGANLPSIGSTGSGIYHGRFGPLTAVMNPDNQTKILVAEVPKFIGNVSASLPVAVPIVPNTPSAMLNLYLKRDQIDKYVSELIVIPEEFSGNSTSLYFDADVCDGDFCCDFDFNVTVLPTNPGSLYYNYRFAAYSGWRTFDGFADGAVRVCAVLACTDESLQSCGRRFGSNVQVEDKIIFDYIKVETVYEERAKVLTMPNSLDTSLLPLNPREFTYNEIWEIDGDEESQKLVTLELTSPRQNLLTFAIYARDFEPKDEKTPGNGNSVRSTLMMILFAVLGLYFTCL